MADPLRKTEPNPVAHPEPDGAPSGRTPGGPGTAVVDGRPEHAGADGAGGALSAWQYRLTVLRHHRPLFRFACALLGTDTDAEDVVQDAFVRYWQHGSAVRKPREWLFRVAHNLCLDRLRSAGRTLSGSLDGELEPDEDRDPAWHYSQRELEQRLHRLIATLPEPQRSLIVLFDIQGLSGEECARIIGINANQVKVYLHRARKRLRVKLEHSHD